MSGINASNALEVICLLVRIIQFYYLELLLYCSKKGISSMQNKAVEIFPRLCENQLVALVVIDDMLFPHNS